MTELSRCSESDVIQQRSSDSLLLSLDLVFSVKYSFGCCLGDSDERLPVDRGRSGLTNFWMEAVETSATRRLYSFAAFTLLSECYSTYCYRSTYFSGVIGGTASLTTESLLLCCEMSTFRMSPSPIVVSLTVSGNAASMQGPSSIDSTTLYSD